LLPCAELRALGNDGWPRGNRRRLPLPPPGAETVAVEDAGQTLGAALPGPQPGHGRPAQGLPGGALCHHPPSARRRAALHQLLDPSGAGCVSHQPFAENPGAHAARSMERGGAAHAAHPGSARGGAVFRYLPQRANRRPGARPRKALCLAGLGLPRRFRRPPAGLAPGKPQGQAPGGSGFLRPRQGRDRAPLRVLHRALWGANVMAAPLQRLAGKVIVLAGGAGGIGSATAQRLAAEGARVVVGDIDQAAAEQVAAAIAAIGGNAIGAAVDIGNRESVDELVDLALATWGRLDGLHANAADLSIQHRDKNALEIDLAMWEHILHVDLTGYLYCTRAALPALLASGGGALVYTSSEAAFYGE